MWIFTNYGFVSAVQYNAKKDTLLVRAREPGVLEAFAERHGIKAKVEKTPKADYLYRSEFKKDDFAKAVADEARRIDYGNFKASFKAAKPENTMESHFALMDVWEVMRTLQLRLETARHWAEDDFDLAEVADFADGSALADALPSKPEKATAKAAKPHKKRGGKAARKAKKAARKAK